MIIKTSRLNGEKLVPGAAAVLPSILLEFASGNTCIVTPAMTRHGRECRIAMVEEWAHQPTEEDDLTMRNYLMAFCNRMGLGPPAWEGAASNAGIGAWLAKKGKLGGGND